MKTEIRSATKNDLPAIYQLIKELAIFEKEPNEPTNPFQQFEKDFKVLFECLVAVQNETIVGIALYYYGYSTWKGKMLYLEDLVVNKDYRKQKIGSQLIDELKNIAKRENVNQMKWQVLEWNEPAINMYKKLNAEILTDWWTCKLSKEIIEQ